MLSTLFISGLLVQSVFTFLSPYPTHASCKIDWNFGVSCPSVTGRLQHQITLWQGENCNGGEKCLYKFVSYENNVLKATHETPKKHYVDDLTFTLVENNSTSCSVNGFSTSETWYAYLDYGTNYCNLHNLVDGAGLTKVPGYSEKSSNSKCTQYTSRNCTKY